MKWNQVKDQQACGQAFSKGESDVTVGTTA